MRSYFRFLTDVPQPLKSFGFLYVGTFILAFAGILNKWSWSFGPLGGAAFLYGVTLALNLNGAAEAMARNMQNQKPLGVDYSNSLFARPTYARIFGLLLAGVGVAFVLGVVFGHWRMR